jgi:lysozyme
MTNVVLKPTIGQDTFDRAALMAELTQDEGRRQFAYSDSLGYLSIGIGRNISGKGLSPAEIDLLFNNDVDEFCAKMDAHISWWRKLSPAHQRCMIDMCFMGWESFSQFVKFFAAIQAADWPTAVKEIENSKWYGQVGTRGPRVVARLLAPDGVAGA